MCCICAGQYELNSVTFIASFIKKSCFSCIPSNDRMYCTPLLYISAIQWTFLRLFHAFRPFPSLKALSELFGNDSAKFKCLNPAVTAKKTVFFSSLLLLKPFFRVFLFFWYWKPYCAISIEWGAFGVHVCIFIYANFRMEPENTIAVFAFHRSAEIRCFFLSIFFLLFSGYLALQLSSAEFFLILRKRFSWIEHALIM